MYRLSLKPAIALAMLAAPLSANAATTITVTNVQETCTTVLGWYCLMNQDYGDTHSLDASYERTDASGKVIGLAHNSIVNFGDLGQVVAAGTNFDDSFGQITLRAKAGYEVRLLDFDFAGYFNFAPELPLAILALNGEELFSGVIPTGNGSDHSTLSVNTIFQQGVIIRWGPRANVAGLDNIRYETRALSAAVPESATWALLIAGFGFVGGAMRRRELPLRAASVA